jgi:RHH-type transcriptional regulator, proline utilization regulon repressor / proline dehydrogenase / delta 1-pyrroline-5-carboxylate dehydrogenase
MWRSASATAGRLCCATRRAWGTLPARRSLPTASPLAQEEIFGPVLAVLRVKTFEEALGLANDSAYALTGGVYSRSPVNIQTARESFDVGNLYINRPITGALVNRQPFGGHRLSGVGVKAGGRGYLEQFMVARVISENTLRRGFAPAETE